MYIKYLKKFLEYFGEKRKLKLLLFAIMGFIAGILEFAGIAMIYPFVTLIINPASASSYAKYIPFQINTTDAITMTAIFGLGAMCLFIIKNLYMILFMFIQCKFMQKWTQSINNYFMGFFLYAPYKIVQKIPNSEKIYALTVLSSQATTGFITRLVTLLTNVLIVLSVIILILCKFFVAGIISFIFVATTIWIQNRLLKRGIDNINNKMSDASKSMNNIMYSNINCIKEIKINAAEKEADYKYEKNGKICTDLCSELNFFSSMTPYMVETIIVISLVFLGWIILLRSEGEQYSLVASYAMLVAAIFRIAPALNRIQSSIINLPPLLNFVIDLIEFYERNHVSKFGYVEPDLNNNIELKEYVEIKNAEFSYDKDIPVLKNISLKLNKGDFVGIVGLSGAGKSTLADVLVGLLPLDKGEILIDGVPLNEKTFYGFRKLVGYVSQDLKIMNCSFRENVAWMVPKDNIDDIKVEKVLKSVCLWDVVETYENGIYAEPVIGESGLSKGQMQRLIIARALYKEPEIILFDEATSALDVKTEHEIVNTLKEFGREKTIISIAHRLSVLQACDKIVYMKDGEIKDIGTFGELSAKHSEFAELVKLSGIDTNKK
ncbi:MAG: ABC transporter ATP-binding protein [Candidatus Gastranaerophilaceae bacterium]|nr:ABC transporter ATP-binding protein [Candidatus Gastranaerophilaceae bacterium]